MNRALFILLGAVAVVCMAAVVSQAAVIPMAYDTTTSTVLLDWDMEGAGTPAVGSVTYYVAPGSPAGTATGVVVGGGSEPAAYEGSQMLKSYRPGVGTTSAYVDFGSTSGTGSAITIDLAFRVEDSASGMTLWPGTNGSLQDIAGFQFKKDGTVWYVDAGAWQSASLTHTVGTWNELSLTHTNGTGNWTMTVNGSAPESMPVTSATGPLTAYLSAVGGFSINNANTLSTVYIDAMPVPEPSTIAMLAAGLLGLLAYAWRKRK